MEVERARDSVYHQLAVATAVCDEWWGFEVDFLSCTGDSKSLFGRLAGGKWSKNYLVH